MSRTTFSTAFGRCAVSWNESSALSRFELPETKSRSDDAQSLPDTISALIARVQRHLDGDLQDFSDASFDFGLVPEFARQVYVAALAVKAGRTATYGEIAATLGQPAAVSRAVGSALGANPWPLLVPCHRIVAANGKMTGFSGPGGVATKARLLALEGAQLL